MAIVGIGLRLPGADSLEAYWDLVHSGRHAISALPESRLDRKRYYQPGPACPGKTYTQLGGTVAADGLPLDTLGLSEAELRTADRAHLIFLHTVLLAIRHAGLDPRDLADQRWGIFVGHARGSALASDLTYSASIESLTAALADTPQLAALPLVQRQQLAERIVQQTHDRYPRFADDGGPFIQPSAAAGLVARRLKTTGPYMAVDAACASSFAALDIAARAIHSGEIEAAVVGGCSFNQWSSLVLFSQAQALSATGSFPFDERADGFISSDGYAAILVEPLSRTLAAGRTPLAILRGIGGSCDGRGKSLWAPLQEGQVEAISRAYDQDLTPDSVHVVEAHATGTAVGDATEIAALSQVFGAADKRGPQHAKRPIASVKANIGHTRETAGLAGLIKMILAMQKGVVPPAASFHTPSTRIDWSAASFRVPATAEPWPDEPGQPRRAAVDAFGIGGLNYHVVLDGPFALAPSLPSPSESIISVGASPEPIAIIGVGVVLPGATDLPAFLRSLTQPTSPTLPDGSRWNAELYHDAAGGSYRLAQTHGHFLRDWQFDWRKYKVPPKQVEHSDPLQYMMIDVVAQALRQAGYTKEPVSEHLRTAVYVGSIFGGDFTSRLNIGLRLPEFEEDLAAGLRQLGLTEEALRAVIESTRAALLVRFPLEDHAGSFSSSTLASRVSKHFDFCGPCCAIDAEEASGLAALSASLTALRTGTCDLALCCAGQRLMHHTRFTHYERLGMLASAHHPGFYLAEGAVAFALRRQSEALRDGQPILALLQDVSGAASAAGPWPALLAAINHLRRGTTELAAPRVIEYFAGGLAKGESQEREILHQSYGQTPPRLVSAAPTFGMAQGASGLVGLVHLLATAEGTDKDHVPVALDSIGLQGLGYHARLEAGALTQTAATPRQQISVSTSSPRAAEPRIIRLAAARLEALRDKIAAANPELLFQSAALPRRFQPSDLFRVAIVANSPTALRAKLALIREPRVAPEIFSALHEQGVFLHRKPDVPPALAFAFSGQGSQYGGMLRELCERYPQTAPVLAEINSVLAELGEPSFADFAWDAERAERLGEDTWLTQISVLCADVLMHTVVRSLGLSPTLILAHSYGEYPALYATGAWSLRTAILATHARCQALAELGPPPGKLISTAANAEQIASLQQSFAGRGFVAPANFNSPEQTVLAVETGLVEDVLAALEQRGEVAKLLPVPQPYHSALLKPAQPALARALAKLPLCPPRTPFLSGVGNSYAADPDEIRARLVRQLTEPLRFTELIRRAYSDGIGVFIEIGPRTILTRLIRAILKGEPALVLCTDHPKVPAAEQLARVQALLETQDLWPAAQRPETPAVAAAAPTTANLFAYPLTRTLPEPDPAAVIPHFDATERRRTKLAARHVEPEPAASPGSVDEPAADQPSEMERFLINFVCEQTGYPPEVVGMDQDLEADLGIDSIKKAQMLGELRDQFNLKLPSSAAGGGLSLAKIVSLRDVSRLLGDQPTGDGKSSPTPVAPEPAAAPVAAALPANPNTAGRVRLHTFSGSRYAIGQQHGVLFATDIERSMNRYREVLGINVLELPEVKAVLGRHQEYFDAASQAEMAGIAAGSQLPYERIVAFNLGLEPEHGLFGCSQVLVRAADNAGAGMIHAANEDSPIALRLGNQLPRYVAVRWPTAQKDTSAHPRQACSVFGSPGQLGGINGVNAAGLVVSSTMLLDQPRDLAAVGIMHPCLVLRILEEADSLEAAIAIVQTSRRVGAWSLLMSHAATDRAIYLEYDGNRFAMQWVSEILCTANHSRLLPGGAVPEHSQHRLARLSTLLPSHPLRPEQVQTMLRDRMDLGRGRVVNHSTMNTVCRVDNQLSFVACAGATGNRLWLTPGPTHGEHQDHYSELHPAAWWSAGPPQTGARAAAEPEVPDEHAQGSRHLMQRFILRAEPDAATPKSATPRPLRTLIVGGGALADRVRQALSAAGSEVRIAPSAEPADLAAGALPPQRLIFLTALESPELFSAATAPERLALLTRHGIAIFTLTQRWIASLRAAGLLKGAELAALTAMGGELGFGSARELRPAGGAISGLFKALRRELPELSIKVLDTAVGEPPALLVRSLLAELSTQGPLEVGSVRGRRQLVRMIPRELTLPRAPVILRDALTPAAAWLVTGGGRGITSLVAQALGERFGVYLHLIGSTSAAEIPARWAELSPAGLKGLRHDVLAEARQQGHNPQEAWREVERRIGLHATLRTFRAAGLRFTYHQADLMDSAALARVVAAARAAGPAIRGILHGAGTESACEFTKKTAQGVLATLGSKVLGLQHLLALTAADAIEAVVGFGSVSGRFGGLGQTDYSMASELLAKVLAAHRRTTAVRTTTFAWPAWGDTGMAMRPESRVALEAAGQEFMPAAEGIAHVLAELAADLPESEVVILDNPALLDADHTALGPSAQRQRSAVQAAPAALLDGVIESRPGLLVADCCFHPLRDLFLLQHQFEGVPILPAVIGMELLAETALLDAPPGIPFALDEVTIHAGLRFYAQRPLRAQIVATPGEHGSRTAVKLLADSFGRNGTLSEPGRLCCSAQVTTQALAPPSHFVAPPPSTQWQEMRYLEGPVATSPAEARRVYHGPVLRTLRRLSGDAHGVWGELVAPSPGELRPAHPHAQWRLPAALLDGCLVACGAFVRQHLGQLSLPAGCGRLTLFNTPVAGQLCIVYLRLMGQQDRFLSFDFTLSDATGAPLLSAQGYRTVLVSADRNEQTDQQEPLSHD